mmetsp:Transcript_30738/g.57570  ORF Transcript_30738/g.57570 Transcript_30738/m.57570 type:complete len:214 (-) Transcript_30738:133-774(-)
MARKQTWWRSRQGSRDLCLRLYLRPESDSRRFWLTSTSTANAIVLISHLLMKAATRMPATQAARAHWLTIPAANTAADSGMQRAMRRTRAIAVGYMPTMRRLIVGLWTSGSALMPAAAMEGQMSPPRIAPLCSASRTCLQTPTAVATSKISRRIPPAHGGQMESVAKTSWCRVFLPIRFCPEMVAASTSASTTWLGSMSELLLLAHFDPTTTR